MHYVIKDLEIPRRHLSDLNNPEQRYIGAELENGYRSAVASLDGRPPIAFLSTTIGKITHITEGRNERDAVFGLIKRLLDSNILVVEFDSEEEAQAWIERKK